MGFSVRTRWIASLRSKASHHRGTESTEGLSWGPNERPFPSSPCQISVRSVPRWFDIFGLELVVACILLTVTAARATTFVPMSIDDLTRSSTAVVIGTVDGLTGVQARDGRLFTLVSLGVDEVLKGTLPAMSIIL